MFTEDKKELLSKRFSRKVPLNRAVFNSMNWIEPLEIVIFEVTKRYLFFLKQFHMV